jgi:chemotaxis signal transduction protein
MYPAPYSIENFTGLLIFEISGTDYCLNNIIVSSILKPPFKSNKGGPAVKPSISFLHGESSGVPLIDMQKIITGRELKTDANSRVIIIDYNEEPYGLLVGRIKEIIALDAKFITTSIQYTPKTEKLNDGSGADYIDGALKFEGRKLLLPSLEKIIKESSTP